MGLGTWLSHILVAKVCDSERRETVRVWGDLCTGLGSDAPFLLRGGAERAPSPAVTARGRCVCPGTPSTGSVLKVFTGGWPQRHLSHQPKAQALRRKAGALHKSRGLWGGHRDPLLSVRDGGAVPGPASQEPAKDQLGQQDLLEGAGSGGLGEPSLHRSRAGEVGRARHEGIKPAVDRSTRRQALLLPRRTPVFTQLI